NLFIGDNGQGKTNLIETLYLLCRGKSFRFSKWQHYLPKESVDKAVRVCAELEFEQKNFQLELFYYNEKKQLLSNQKKITWSKSTEFTPAILFSPESLSVIKGSSAERREMIDNLLLLSRPYSHGLLHQFEKALKQRNRILKNAAKEITPVGQAKSLLDSLDVNYLKLAAELTFERVEAIKDILPDFKNNAKEILNQKDVDISVDYVVSDEKANSWTLPTIHAKLRERRDQLLAAELSSGQTLVGPHKHDISFIFQGHDSRHYCSQGQQRALILSLKIAKIMYYKRLHQEWPVLFLDDVFSELDIERRSQLVKFLKASEGQTFLTSTEISLTEDLCNERSKVFKVTEGVVC
ncbi:MAG: DNA replication and repair protein RecF, partial [Bdellovibrionales bacterium]|nr:DNA replication and repair protein RecF [Bdellovibrionales bacterium]